MKVWYGFDLANELSFVFRENGMLKTRYFNKVNLWMEYAIVPSTEYIVDFPGYKKMKSKIFKSEKEIIPFLEREYPEIFL